MRTPYTYSSDSPTPRVVRMLKKSTPLDEGVVSRALETGQLLTAHQAALAVGVKIGTFNYHLRQGRIPYLPTPGGVRYVWLKDAQAFAAKLDAWRTARHFEAFGAFGVVGTVETAAVEDTIHGPTHGPTESSSTCA